MKDKTDELILIAVKTAPWIFSYAFLKNPDPNLCLKAVKENGKVLEHIVNQTPEMCYESVRQNGLNLRFVKDKDTFNKLYDIAYNDFTKKYTFYDYFCKFYSSVIEKSLNEQREWLFEKYEIEEIKQLIVNFAELETDVFEKIDELDFNEIKPYLENYNIKYSSKEVLNLCLLNSELDENHYKLNNLILLSGIDIIFKYMMGDLTILDNNKMNKLNLDYLGSNLFEHLRINNDNVEFFDFENDTESNDDFIIDKYYLNGELTFKKRHYNRVQFSEEGENYEDVTKENF